MKHATKTQVADAEHALDELTAYCSADEDAEFARLNARAAETQRPLAWWQRWRLYAQAPLHAEVCEGRHRR